jgi:hypothetical protein
MAGQEDGRAEISVMLLDWLCQLRLVVLSCGYISSMLLQVRFTDTTTF